MNILVPDSWLREFLKTKATPKQIKEYLSLCGPSVERINTTGKETIYDIEITSNRPDSMSVVGIAREAAAILPRFGIAAKLVGDPYTTKGLTFLKKVKPFEAKFLAIKTDPVLCPRWTSVVFDNVTIKSSLDWLKKKLEATGIRSINNVIDITNFLMRAYGQPTHAFDFDAISDKPNHATMILRASKKGEKLTTLDGNIHTLPGDDIIIEDGKGRLIDLCGIMGAQNSAIRETTKTVILFLQTYDPIHIRRTMMGLAHRTDAGSLFEKGTDSELVLPAFLKGIELLRELTGGRVASKLYDIYPKPYKPYTVSVNRTKIDAYLGARLSDKEIISILEPLGFTTKVTKDAVTVTIPSFRRDVEIDVDIIEELARIYGYHNISSTLPDTAPPMTGSDPVIAWEEEIKVRLRDWGYTETYTYSMISDGLMDIFGLDKTKAYKISNPLSSDWVYMRPTLWPSILTAVKENLNYRSDLMLFELSMAYAYRQNDLPLERPMLMITMTGERFYELKGIAESILALLGAQMTGSRPVKKQGETPSENGVNYFVPERTLTLGDYGVVGEINQDLLVKLEIKLPVTVLQMDIAKLIADAKPQKTYVPIPKYPPVVEDLAFTVPAGFTVGPLMAALKKTHPLVAGVTLLDMYKDTRTFHVVYLNPRRNLTDEDVRPVREKLIARALELGAVLKV